VHDFHHLVQQLRVLGARSRPVTSRQLGRLSTLLLARALLRPIPREVVAPTSAIEPPAPMGATCLAADALVLPRPHRRREPLPTLRAPTPNHRRQRLPAPPRARTSSRRGGSRSRRRSPPLRRRGGSRSRRWVDHDEGAAEAQSGETLRSWAKSHGVDGRSLRAWQRNISRRGSSAPLQREPRLVELVRTSSTPRPPQRYVVRVGEGTIEVGDDFDDHTLRRLLEVLRAC